jgi:hypothetical protein
MRGWLGPAGIETTENPIRGGNSMKKRLVVLTVMGLVSLILTIQPEAWAQTQTGRYVVPPGPIPVPAPAIMAGDRQVNISGTFLDANGIKGEMNAVFYLDEGDFLKIRRLSTQYQGSGWIYSDPGQVEQVGVWEIKFSSFQGIFSLTLSMMGYDEYVCRLLPKGGDALAGKCVGNVLIEGEDSDLIEAVGGDIVMEKYNVLFTSPKVKVRREEAD